MTKCHSSPLSEAYISYRECFLSAATNISFLESYGKVHIHALDNHNNEAKLLYIT